MKFLAFFCSIVLLTGCPSPKTCKYEKEYNATADSLKKYPPIISASNSDAAIMEDLTKLSCSDYMEKYNLNDKDLKLILETAEITWSISSAFRSIEENMKLMDENELQRAEEAIDQLQDSTDYSFHPKGTK